MKKIMFNDRYGLTQAVLDGKKTMTRREITIPKKWKGIEVRGYVVCKNAIGQIVTYLTDDDDMKIEGSCISPRYEICEVVSVAQSYKDIVDYYSDKNNFTFIDYILYASQKASYYRSKKEERGWNNKMFVFPGAMPFRIRITDIRLEKLQDISELDCLREGIREVEISNNWGNSATHTEYVISYLNQKGCSKLLRGRTPHETYSTLIDLISGIGTWERNPYVWVYEFELIK